MRKARFPFLMGGLISTLYVCSFSFSFFTLTEGWFSFAAQKISQGSRPYSDFFLFLPPGYPWLMHGLQNVVGLDFQSLRMLGILAIIFFYICLYKIFRKFVVPEQAALIATFLVVFYSGNNAFITYDFMQFMNLALAGSLLFILRGLEKPEHPVNFFFAGIALGFALLLKQSNPTLVLVFASIAMIIYTLRFRNMRSFASFLVGSATPVAAACILLFFQGSLSAAIQQIFVDASSAKGGTEKILTAWMSLFINPNYFEFSKNMVLFFILAGYPFYLLRAKKAADDSKLRKLIDGGAVLLTGIALLIVYEDLLPAESLTAVRDFSAHLNEYIWFLATNVSIAITIIAAATFIFTKRHASWMFTAFFSSGLIYGSGTSAGIGDAGVYLGLGLALLILLRTRSFFGFGRLVTLYLMGALLIFYSDRKYSRPYHWWGTVTPSVHSDLEAITDLPVISGLKVDHQTHQAIARLFKTISSTNAKSLVSFPHAPIFNLVSGLPSPGKALVYWYDFFPDHLVEEELSRLQNAPPDVAIMVRLDNDAASAHERLFRGGKKLPHQNISNFLTGESYERLATEQINGVPIEIWRLKTRTNN